jgi:hypothetical protein
MPPVMLRKECHGLISISGEKGKTMSAITIIEPHADDAFLSLHGHIQSWIKQGHVVTIRTIHGDARRMDEAQRYADAVGCEWESHVDYLADTPRMRTAVLPHAQFDTLVLPLGLKHPDHIDARLHLDTGGSWYYVDMPYALVQRDNAEVNEQLSGMEVISFMKPHARKWRHLSIFESQKRYFSHFHRADAFKPAAFEMVVTERKEQE